MKVLLEQLTPFVYLALFVAALALVSAIILTLRNRYNATKRPEPDDTLAYLLDIGAGLAVQAAEQMAKAHGLENKLGYAEKILDEYLIANGYEFVSAALIRAGVEAAVAMYFPHPPNELGNLGPVPAESE